MRGVSRRRAAATVLVLFLAGCGSDFGTSPVTTSHTVIVTTLSIPLHVGPGAGLDCPVAADLYTPDNASAATPVPALLTTNPFGGSKDDQAGLAQFAARLGYEVLSYSGLGFGNSPCPIELDDPDWDGAAAHQLVDWLAARPEVKRDGPGDPRVAVVGGSYGGGLALLAAATDPRVDVAVPFVAWNDLATSLAPDDAGHRPGVVKIGWMALMFGAGARQPLDRPKDAPNATFSGCPGFDPSICVAMLEAAATHRLTAKTSAVLGHRTIALDQVRAATLLVQGQADTLFPINEAIATYRTLKANQVPVKLVLQSWGHSHLVPVSGEFDPGDPGPTYEGQLVAKWLDRYLAGHVTDTGPEVEYFRDWVPGGAAAAYAGAPSWPVGSTTTWVLSSDGGLTAPADAARGTVTLIHPLSGLPASYSETPGVQDRPPFSTKAPNDVDGQSVAFTTDAFPSDAAVVGAPVLEGLHVSLDQAGSDGVLFAKLYDVDPSGSAELVHRLIAAFRVGPEGGDFTVTLPTVVHRVAAGHRLRLVLTTTDAFYLTPVDRYRVIIELGPDRPTALAVPLTDA